MAHDERGNQESAAELGELDDFATRRRPQLADWDGPDDADDPRNWSENRKWTAAILISLFTLLSPIASAMVAPVLDSISKDLHISTTVEKNLVVSIFVLGYATGPLVFAPLSEVYGRVIVILCSNLVYLILNVACAVSQTKAQMITFRFLGGIGGSAPLVVGGGVVADCFRVEKRGKAMATYALAPLLGPALGPIIGGFVGQATSWRWIFHVTTIAAGVLEVAGVVFLRESHHPTIRRRRVKRHLQQATPDPNLLAELDNAPTLASGMRVALLRPFRLLFTQPIIQALGGFAAYIYGLMYLMLVSFPALWSDPDRYDESTNIGSLNYVSLGIGFVLGAQISGMFVDRIHSHLKTRNGGVAKPEFRLPLLGVGAAMTPAGLFLYGWSAQYGVHWIVPNLGACLFAAGTILGFQCIQTYVLDAYTQYAASATAAVVVLRSLAGFAFPLFASSMYEVLDYGWGTSLLAFVSIGIGLPAPVLLWIYGERLRNISRYAVK